MRNLGFRDYNYSPPQFHPSYLNLINQAIQTVVLSQFYLSWGFLLQLFVLPIHTFVKFVLLLLQFLVTT